MHKDDQMTPNERMAGFFSGEEIDRLPAMPFTVSVAGKVAGMTHREKRSCAKNQAQGQIACYERFGNDGMTIEYGLHGVGTACGSITNDPEDGVPAIMDHFLKSLDELDKLDLEKIRKKNDPWLQLNYEATEICLDKWGHEVGVSISIPGPFTAASSLFPIEKMLRQTRKQPEKVHELLRFCTDAVKTVIKEFIPTGAGMFLCDPIASGTIIDRKNYREFVLPYTKELMDYTHELGTTMGYHICGDTTAITADMLESGCDILSVDNRVDLKTAKEIAGSKVPILGNVDPITIMMQGSPDQVDEAVKECLRKAWDSPKGYIVSTGCDIPINGPLENIDRFMEATRKFAKCPLDPENFK
ncbi:uroporphyrinogen decarboxylase family protein [Zhenpiania hominis]|uniref:uroporphyrinogen decarboxylase family protein n=1 Tax=Zhenpiania hominis TaxID=2763644 RepID=UPI0039F4E022